MQIQSNVFVGIKPSLQHQSTLLDSKNSNHLDPHNASKSISTDMLVDNCDYILMPITNNRYRETVMQLVTNYQDDNEPFKPLLIPEPQLQDICISPFNIKTSLDPAKKGVQPQPSYIGLLSSWLELESNDMTKREMSYQVLLNECKYAKYVGINKLILAPPHDITNLKYYAQMIARILNHDVISDPSSDIILSISLPLCEESDPLATWDLWNTVRRLCDYHPSLMISLAVPRVKTPRHVLNRWLTEPVSCLLVSSSIFATNQYNYPVLHKFNQNLIIKFQQINGNSQLRSNSLCIILHGMEKYSNFIKGGELAYLEYINYLLKRGDKLALTSSTRYSNEFRHNIPQLMNPLKPHSETLTNSIYSIFEKDITKYEVYWKAIRESIIDSLNSSQFKNSKQKLVILVAGAGRGPLVDKTFNIVKELKLMNRVELLALEKNSQAFLYLQKRNFEHWNNFVKLINKDMTKWGIHDNDNTKVDICISELLGSFGCNELSPECLWNIEKRHSKPSTIFIPESYTSYVAPVACPLLYQKLSREEEPNHLLESPWVMHGIPFNILSSRVNELWTFHHPVGKAESTIDNITKSVTTEFKIKHRGEIHGLVGFFTAKLYKSIVLSIIPDDTMVKRDVDGQRGENDDEIFVEKMDHTKRLYSWSPMIFPLREPIIITDDTEVSILINRNTDTKKVWYEWTVESYIYLVVSSNKGSSKRTTNKNTKGVSMGMDDDTPHMHITNNTNTTTFATDDTEKHQEFESTINENGFIPSYENGWQSVNDIHGLAISTDNHPGHSQTEPTFNLGSALSDPPSIEPTAEDIHVRVKTGVSRLHNINGISFNVPL